MAFTVNKKAFCVLEFAKTGSIVTVQRRFRIMYHAEPSTDKTIREWHMNSSRVAACSFRSSVWYMIRNLRCTVTIDSVLANSKTQNAFLFTVNAIFRHNYPLAVEPESTPRPLLQKKLGEILYLLICSFLPCLSWLLRSWVRKSRRDLWIILYNDHCQNIHNRRKFTAYQFCPPRISISTKNFPTVLPRMQHVKILITLISN